MYNHNRILVKIAKAILLTVVLLVRTVPIMAAVTEPTLTVVPNPAQAGDNMTATMEFPPDFFCAIRNISWEAVTVIDGNNTSQVENTPNPSPPYPLMYTYCYRLPYGADYGSEYKVVFRCQLKYPPCGGDGPAGIEPRQHRPVEGELHHVIVRRIGDRLRCRAIGLVVDNPNGVVRHRQSVYLPR